MAKSARLVPDRMAPRVSPPPVARPSGPASGDAAPASSRTMTEMSTRPSNICELTAIRAPTLTGAMSPYPTVPSVTTVK